MMRAAVIALVLVAAEALAAAAPREPAFDEAALLEGAALGLPESTEPVPVPTAADAFALDAEMQAFVQPFRGIRDPRERLLALARGLESRGMFSLDYAEVTRTASGTFHDRQGNCLSFTMLFVALARAAGLHASYHSVDVPPSWSYDGQVVVANHLNTAVRTSSREQTIVDFNIRPYKGSQQSRRVDDAYVLGLFYTNLGAEALLRGQYDAALVYLREAAAAHADIAGIWVNLGVLYGRRGLLEHAEAAYLRALESDDDEQSALANLALVYVALGETELAAEYQERVQEYRELNPYYHFAMATRAYEEQRFSTALSALRKALRLKRDEHAFHALRAQVLAALGRPKDAIQSFERAREYELAEQLRVQSRVAFDASALR